MHKKVKPLHKPGEWYRDQYGWKQEPYPEEEKKRIALAKKNQKKFAAQADIYTQERINHSGFTSKHAAKKLKKSKQKFTKVLKKTSRDLSHRDMDGKDIYKYLLGHGKKAPKKVAEDTFDVHLDLDDDGSDKKKKKAKAQNPLSALMNGEEEAELGSEEKEEIAETKPSKYSRE